MFGKFVRNVDDKNRISIPAKLRDNLGTKFYMTIGLENKIELRSQSEFEEFASKLLAQSQFSKEARIIQRAWLGNTQEIELDSQGRFIIPKQFIQISAIQKEVTLIGLGKLVELWASEVYEDYQNKLDDETIDNALYILSKN